MNKNQKTKEYEKLQTEVDSIMEMSGILNVLGNSFIPSEDECFDINLILSDI